MQSDPDISQFLKGVLASGLSEDTSESSENLNHYYKKGWLQAELLANGKRVYIFPSKLHEMYAKILLSSDVQEFPQRRFSSVWQLCFEAISKFSPALLLLSLVLVQVRWCRPRKPNIHRSSFALAITYLGTTCSLPLSGQAHLLMVRWTSISNLSNGQLNALETGLIFLSILRDSNQEGHITHGLCLEKSRTTSY